MMGEYQDANKLLYLPKRLKNTGRKGPDGEFVGNWINAFGM